MRMEDCLSGDGLRKKGTGGPFAMGSGAFPRRVCVSPEVLLAEDGWHCGVPASGADRKSTRLNSSHLVISYAVFCLKKKKKKQTPIDLLAFQIRHLLQHSSCTVSFDLRRLYSL